MKAMIDADACIGCGLCVNTCAEVFEMKDDKAVVVGKTVPAGSEDACRRAADDCPVTAITVA